jgi:dihydrodipicolinate synthase/N-acetylneuraminate lyase
MSTFSGVWIPLVTPFLAGELDLQSYERLVEHYMREGAAGLFPLGTTGESPALDAAETAPPALAGAQESSLRRKSRSHSPSQP